jgi:Cu-processing system permease protein
MMQKILKYVFLDILKNRMVIGYTILLSLLSMAVFNMETSSSKGILSLLNVVLIIVPLVSIIFSTMYFYNASEFIELLVAQPLRRSQIWLSLCGGLSCSLMTAFLMGAGIPILVFDGSAGGIMIIITGTLLTLIFVTIASLASAITRDKAKGIGLSILIWLFFTLLYDGLVLFLLFQLMDYPVEKGLVALTIANPVDLSRILILLQMDVSALMGVTSAIFKKFFGTHWGSTVALLALLLWAAIPLFFSLRTFKHKDL